MSPRVQTKLVTAPEEWCQPPCLTDHRNTYCCRWRRSCRLSQS
jgi:hypothetical protein